MKNTKGDLALEIGAKKLHEARRKSFEKAQLYYKSFTDPSTGYLRKELVEARNCPVCDVNIPAHLFVKNGANYVQCRGCTMIYVNPVFTDKAQTDYYNNNTDAQAETTSDEAPFYRVLFEQGLDLIEKTTRAGSVLDVGASSGFFLDICKERGYKTYGIELNLKVAELARKKGHQISTNHLSQSKLDLKYDLITLWDVFEHIRDGFGFLELAKKHLSQNGVLFLQVPNASSLAARIMHEKSNMYDGVEHINMFDQHTLPKLADRCGFEVLSIGSVISEIPVINNYLNYQDPYYGDYPTSNNVLGLIDEEELHKNLLGYKLQFVLRPKNN